MTAPSLTQLEVIEKLTEPGSDGVLVRWDGGFWAPTGTPWQWQKDIGHEAYRLPQWSTTVQTVRAMERKGLLRRLYRHPEEWRDDRQITEAWLDLGLTQNHGTQLSALSRTDLERMPTDDLDRAAFGFGIDDVIEVAVAELHVRYPGDMENAEHSVRTLSQARHVLREAPPIDVSLRGGVLCLEDGHHRYVAARLLGRPTLTAVVKDISDNPIDRILTRGTEFAPNKKSVRTLEAERMQASGARRTGQQKISRLREQIAALEADKRANLARINAFAKAARARTIIEPTTLVRGDRCHVVSEDRSRQLRGAVDAFYDALRREISKPIEEQDLLLREDIDRTRDITAIQTKTGRRAASAIRHQKKKESVSESDDEVESNITDPALLLVWRTVKRSIHGSDKMERYEAFEHWVHEHPEEVMAILAEQLEPTEEEFQRAQAEHYAESAAASDDEVPF